MILVPYFRNNDRKIVDVLLDPMKFKICKPRVDVSKGKEVGSVISDSPDLKGDSVNIHNLTVEQVSKLCVDAGVPIGSWKDYQDMVDKVNDITPAKKIEEALRSGK